MALDLDRLNARQREAVLHGNGPLLILAGAGSGKTSTMAYRIAHLVTERHVPPMAVLGLSFTNKAASELKERVLGLIRKSTGKRPAPGLTITTFHSLCVRVLREHGTQLGFQQNFTIIDRNDQMDILRQILRLIKIDDRKFDLDKILFEIGQAKSRFLSGDAAQEHFLADKRLGQDYAIAVSSAYPRYQEQLRLLNAMDFDDLLFYGVKLLEDHAEVRAHYNARFRHVLVDEYQDTNPTQFRLLSLLTQRSQNLCVVGDDDQSIYSWRGADPSHILEFARHFRHAPEGVKSITLDQNYRSTNTILEAANHVIQNNRTRHPKSLWSERGPGALISEVIVEEDRAEAEFVAQELFKRQQEQNLPWKSFAVLYRSNAQSRVFEEALRRFKIPYKIVGGYSFLDLKEVKDVLSYWRLIVNPRDDASLRRIINWPARGIGKTSIEAFSELAFKRELPMFEALGDHVQAQVAPKSILGVTGFRNLVLSLQAELTETPPTPEAMASWARRSLERIGARKAIEDECDDAVKAVKRWENLDELLHSLGQMKWEVPEGGLGSPSTQMLQEFLSRLTLQAQEDEDDKKENAKDNSSDQVTLLTLHGAKGLEYPTVFLVGMEEGIIPHRRTIEEGLDFSEERRLCYVGITRARDHLILTRCRNRIRYGKPVPRLRSRFLQEIPTSSLETRDESHGPDRSDSVETRKVHEEVVKNHLADIRAMLSKSGPRT
jgi:DNA helicase II / ATP-dependent DNA helicase PcrA